MRLLDEAEDRVGVPEQHLAGVGQGDRAPALRALDQPVPDPPLEDRDLLADRRLREAQARRGAPERALAGDRPQRCEVAELDTGPGAERAERSGSASLAAGGQPPFCFPPARVCMISDEPAIIRG